MSRSCPDLVLGEKVVLEVPLQPMTRGPQHDSVDHTTVHSFVKHVELQILQIYEKFGADCADFELKLQDGFPVGIYFTRPMDQLELLEVRAWRRRQQQARDEQIAKELQPNERYRHPQQQTQSSAAPAELPQLHSPA
jgi:hypothetical protein